MTGLQTVDYKNNPHEYVRTSKQSDSKTKELLNNKILNQQFYKTGELQNSMITNQQDYKTTGQ